MSNDPLNNVKIASREDDLTSLCDFVVSEVSQIKNYLLGRILTIVDASYSDQTQRKAIKDLVKSVIYEKEWFSDNIVRMIYSYEDKDHQEYFEPLKPHTNILKENTEITNCNK